MLSAATLDGYNQRPNVGAGVRAEHIKPFAGGDYAEGFKAGANDRKWSDFYAERAHA